MKELALSQSWYWLLLVAFVSYLMGCVNFAVIISKARHKDVRKIGSGNPGTMNMSREFGLKVGLVNFLFDSFKGGIPVIAVHYIFEGYVFTGTTVLISDVARYVAGVMAVIGHIYPVFLKFRGGKGIATTYGVFWFALGCENPWFFLIMLFSLILVLLFILITEMGSMGSLLGVTAFSLWQGVIFYDRYVAAGFNGYVIFLFMLLLFMNFLTWFSHRKNLVRLLAGEEHRTSVKKLHGGKRGMDNM